MKVAKLSTVGLVLSMYGLWMAFARLPMGIAGDLLGRRKPLIVFGIFLTAAGAVIMGRGNSIFTLAAGTWVLLIVVFSSFFDVDEAVFASSMLTFSASLGRMVSTASTGFLNRVGGYKLSFYCRR